MTSLAVPLIAGLTAGIALIVVFSLNFDLTHTFRTPVPLVWPEDEKFVIHIPLGASIAEQNKTFTPENTRAALDYNKNCCGVIKWVNDDTVPAMLRADDDSDPEFYRATSNLLIEPGGSFEYTFTKPGEYGFHGRPWQHGIVEILSGFLD